MLFSALFALHVCANLFWIGSITSVGIALSFAEVPPIERGQIALSVYRRLAVPAFVVAFAAGLSLLLRDPTRYLLHSHWMHAKLVLVAVVIGLHHVLGAKAKRMAKEPPKTSPGLLPVAFMGVAAAGAALFALLKPF